MSMTYTTIEAARGRDGDKERQHGPGNIVTVWDKDDGRKLELTAHELEEYEQAEGGTLDEDIIGAQRFDALLEWLREEELLEQVPAPSQPAPTATNPRTPAIEELRIMLDAAEYWIDAEADEEHPDPMDEVCSLVRDASTTLASVEAEHAELRCMLQRLLDGVLRLPELPSTLCPLDIEQARAAISKAKGGAR